jgi:hypothetical protein
MARIGWRISRACQVLTIAMGGLAALAAGCDECTPGATRCHGDVFGWCTDDGDGPFNAAHWNEGSCPVACHAAGGFAACVDSRQPVPECAGDPDGGICFENAPSGCWDGYLTRGQSCGSTTHCVISSACGAICVGGDAPEPRCAQDFFCDGSDAVVSCLCGYVLYRFPCSSGHTCREMTPATAAACLPQAG